MVTLPKGVLRVVTVFAAAFLALVIGSSQAMAYPACNIDVTASSKVVRSGGKITFNASNTMACNWSIEFNGKTRTSNGAVKAFSATFTAPKVSKRTEITATTTCKTPAAANARFSVSASCDANGGSVSFPVAILPASANAGPKNNGGDLPNTGGPSWYLLAGGLLLLLAGAGAVRASRRETAEVEES